MENSKRAGIKAIYAHPKEQLIYPFDTVYVNEKEALIAVAKENGDALPLLAYSTTRWHIPNAKA